MNKIVLGGIFLLFLIFISACGVSGDQAPGDPTEITNPLINFLTPKNGETVEFDDVRFRIDPVAGAEGYAWVFTQNNNILWDTLKDEQRLTDAEYIFPDYAGFREKVEPGELTIQVRARIKGDWSEPITITIYLKDSDAASVATASPTSVNTPTPVPETRIVGQVGGESHAVAQKDDHAFLGVGSRMVVVDATDPSNPVQVGQTGILPSFVGNITVEGEYAYLTCFNEGGFWIYDISDVQNPIETGFLNLGGYPISLDVQDDFAYVGHTNGLYIVDVSNPSQPLLEGTFSHPDYVVDVSVAGNHAYLAVNQSMIVLDVSNPSEPVERGQYVASKNIGDLAAYGNYAYLASGWDVLSIDTSDPDKPFLAATVSLPKRDWAEPWIVSVYENSLYVGGNELYIIDISNPVSPDRVGHLALGGSEFAPGPEFLYISMYDGGMNIVDVTNSSRPEKIGTFQPLGSPNGLALKDNALFVSDYTGTHIFDVSDPSTPVGKNYIKGVRLGTLSGDHGYLFGEGLQIYDLSDPFNPAPMGKVNFGIYGIEGIAVADPYAYAIGYERFSVIDISNPDAPSVKGSVPIAQGQAYGGRKVAVLGNYAYVANGEAGFQVFDISDPAKPRIVATIDTPGHPSHVVISGNYAYVTENEGGSGGGGMYIIDISDPYSPREIDVRNSSGSGGLAISGDTLYLADWYWGLGIFDISNPTDPYDVDTFEGNGSYSTDVVVGNGYAFIGWNHRGLIILRSMREELASAKPNAPTCTSGWSRLQVGKYANVSTDSPESNRIRSEPAITDNVIAELGPGSVVKIFDGPVCADGYLFWKVENSTIPGGSGWTAEGDGMEYWLELYKNTPVVTATKASATPKPTATPKPSATFTKAQTPKPTSTKKVVPSATPKASLPPEKSSWKKLTGVTGLPFRGMQAVYDSARNLMVLFGGTDDRGNTLNQTWEFDGKTWKKQTMPVTPSKRFWHGMAYDSNRNVVVLFGGDKATAENGGGVLNDTWEYNGTDWKEIDTSHKPLPRGNGVLLVFDSCREKTVMFGGRDSRGMSTATWEYDGSDWTQVSTTERPPGRVLSAMVFDPVHCRVVLFGGGDNGKAFNDTWEYDGTDWVKAAPDKSPSGRWGHAMAFNPVTNHVILFGGYTGNTQSKDTWSYDGDTWERITTTFSPSAREQHGMVFDGVNGQVLVINGYGSDGNWAFTEGIPQPTPAFSVDPKCALGYSRLKIGDFAQPAGEPSLANRIRSEPKIGNNILIGFTPGMFVKLVDGPVCADGFVFWKVESRFIPGGVGWTAEGDGINYFLEPLK